MSLNSTKTPDDSTLSPDVTKLSGFTGSTTTFLRGDGSFATPTTGGTTGITQLTGDVLAGPGTGSVVSTLATTGVVAGTFGSSTEAAVITVNAKGLVTTIATVSISTTSGSGITAITGDLSATGPGSVTGTLATTGVAAGSYGSGALVPVITVDAKGRVTTISTAAISGVGGDYVKIQEITTTGTIAVFSSLGAYTHLELRFIARSTIAATTDVLNITINNDNGANYDVQALRGRNATASASQGLGDTTADAITVTGSLSPAGYPATGIVRFEDYRSTTFHKGFEIVFGIRTSIGSNFFATVVACAWRSTAAITTISLTLAATTSLFASGTRFSLYGIT